MLCNTAYRIDVKRELTIGFFGGSITEGAGASSWNDTSWRANFMRYLRETYNKTKFTEINAAVGGTGTDLGAYRLKHDLLDKNPDLVIIEFATNDSLLSYKDQYRYYESCIRQILEKDPTTEIVCLFTVTKAIEDHLLWSGQFSSRTAETVLAYHYDLDIVDIGEYFRRAVLRAGGNWGKYTTDNTHPNDDGYLIYSRAMIECFERLIAGLPTKIEPKKIPAPYIDESKIVRGKMVDAYDTIVGNNRWAFVNMPFKWRFPHYIVSRGVGSEINFEFEGSSFGIYWIMDKDCGMVDVTLDGEETVTVSAFDEYCKQYSRGGYVFPFKEFENGKHTVNIRVSEEKDPESEGNKIAIYSFLIA